MSCREWNTVEPSLFFHVGSILEAIAIEVWDIGAALFAPTLMSGRIAPALTHRAQIVRLPIRQHFHIDIAGLTCFPVLVRTPPIGSVTLNITSAP